MKLTGPIPKNATEWRIEDAVVQVNAYGIWGIVCSDGWSNTEATVLCKTLNSEYTLGITQVGNRPPTVPMWISQVMCDTNATNINMCSRKTLLESPDYCKLGGVAQTFCFRGENDCKFSVNGILLFECIFIFFLKKISQYNAPI